MAKALLCFYKTGDLGVLKDQFLLLYGSQREPLHGWDVCSMLWENPSGLCPMPHEHREFSIWRVVRFTPYLYPSFYSILLKWLFYSASCCRAFLWRCRKGPGPSLPLSHPPCSSGNSTYCRYTTEHAEPENLSQELNFCHSKQSVPQAIPVWNSQNIFFKF